MANSYTWPIKDGTDVTLRGYLLRLGPRERRTLNPYYMDRIRAAVRELDRLQAMSDHEAQVEAFAHFDERHAEWLMTRDEGRAMRVRYEAVMTELEAWEAPEALADLKNTALMYLRESMDHDLDKPGHEMSWFAEPRPQQPTAYRRAKYEAAQRELARAARCWEEESKRVDAHNEQLELLLASFPEEAK